jgi:hypothetical protein
LKGRLDAPDPVREMDFLGAKILIEPLDLYESVEVIFEKGILVRASSSFDSKSPNGNKTQKTLFPCLPLYLSYSPPPSPLTPRFFSIVRQ